MYIAVDVGGTSTRIATSRAGKTIHDKERFSTSQSFEIEVKRLFKQLESLLVRIS